MPEQPRAELQLALHQIIFVAAKGRAGVVIAVVLGEGDILARAEFFERGLQQGVAGEVISHRIADGAALGRRVFRVAHVDVESAAVQQKAAVTRRLFVVAIVQVDHAGSRLFEKGDSSPAPAKHPGRAADLR